MPLDTRIISQVGQGVEPIKSPLEVYSKILGVQNQQQDQELGRQQIESNRATAERNARADQQNAEKYAKTKAADDALAKLLSENTSKGDDGSEATNYPAVIRGLSQQGHGEKALALETQWRADQKTQNDNMKAQIENAKNTLALSSSALGSLVNTPDDQLPQAYEATRQQLMQSGLFKPEQVPDFATLQQQSGGNPRAWLQQQQQRGIEASKQVDQHQKDLEFQQHLLENGPELAAKKLKTVGDELATAGQLLGVASSQEQWDAGLQWLKEAGVSKRSLDQIGPMYSPEAVKRVAERALTSKDRADNTRADAAAIAAQANADASRALTKRGQDMVDARAREALKQSTIEGMDGVPKYLQAPAAAAFSKSAIAYQDARATADDIQNVIDLVKSGNKAAGSNLPLLGVGALNAINGIKRMNKAEIDQYQGAGSLYDKITGKLGGLAEGKPIPADVLADIETLHKTLAEGAAKKHAGEVSAINVSHGSNFKPMGGGSADKHRIRVNGKVYEYKGSGDTADMKNYTEVKP